MVAQNQRRLFLRIGCGTLIAVIAISSQAQNIESEVLRFSCDGIRRDGDRLESELDASSGANVAVFSCKRRSCVMREQTEAIDGSMNDVVKQIYILPGETEYISTFTLWKTGSLDPFSHRATVRRFSNCSTTGAYAPRWYLDFGDVRYEGDTVYALPKNDGAESFFHAPEQFHGDWSEFQVVSFSKLSTSEHPPGTNWQRIRGDIVLDSGDMRALYTIPSIHDGEWHRFQIPLDDEGWKLIGGASTMADILPNVTGFSIRAEYGPIEGETAIRNVVVE